MDTNVVDQELEVSKILDPTLSFLLSEQLARPWLSKSRPFADTLSVGRLLARY